MAGHKQEIRYEIWCTKWLFTSGILEMDVKDGYSNNVVETIPKEKYTYPIYLHGEGKEWHKTKESAVAKAEEMRIKKLQALDKQMKKIAAMKFE